MGTTHLLLFLLKTGYTVDMEVIMEERQATVCEHAPGGTQPTSSCAEERPTRLWAIVDNDQRFLDSFMQSLENLKGNRSVEHSERLRGVEVITIHVALAQRRDEGEQDFQKRLNSYVLNELRRRGEGYPYEAILVDWALWRQAESEARNTVAAMGGPNTPGGRVVVREIVAGAESADPRWKNAVVMLITGHVLQQNMLNTEMLKEFGNLYPSRVSVTVKSQGLYGTPAVPTIVRDVLAQIERYKKWQSQAKQLSHPVTNTNAEQSRFSLVSREKADVVIDTRRDSPYIRRRGGAEHVLGRTLRVTDKRSASGYAIIPLVEALGREVSVRELAKLIEETQQELGLRARLPSDGKDERVKRRVQQYVSDARQVIEYITGITGAKFLSSSRGRYRFTIPEGVSVWSNAFEARIRAEEGLEHLQNNRTEEAIGCFEEAWELCPKVCAMVLAWGTQNYRACEEFLEKKGYSKDQIPQLSNWFKVVQEADRKYRQDLPIGVQQRTQDAQPQS
jgi:hypothetical protein